MRGGRWRGSITCAVLALGGGCTFDYDLFQRAGSGGAGGIAGVAGGGATTNGSGGVGATATGATGAGAAGGDAPGGAGGTTCANRALHFDGDDDRVELEPSPSLNGLTAFTVEAWINPEGSLANDELHIFSHHDHDQRVGWSFFVSGDELTLRLYAIGEYFPHSQAVVLSPGTWHHVAATFGVPGVSLFADGARLGPPAAPPPVTSPEPFNGRPSIGASAVQDDHHWAGHIDEVRISKIARYTGGTYPVPNARFSSDPDTLGLFHFDEADGMQAIEDEAGSLTGHLGTMMGVDGSDPSRSDIPCIGAL